MNSRRMNSIMHLAKACILDFRIATVATFRIPSSAIMEIARNSSFRHKKLAPHGATLGMLFYSGSMFLDRYHGQVFIAEHGSWNRSRKIGYRVSIVRMEGGRPAGCEVFGEGWLRDTR